MLLPSCPGIASEDARERAYDPGIHLLCKRCFTKPDGLVPGLNPGEVEPGNDDAVLSVFPGRSAA